MQTTTYGEQSKDKGGTYVPPHRRQANSSVPSVCPVVVGEHPPPRTEEGIRLKGVIYSFDRWGWIQCNDPHCAETGNWFCFDIDSIIGNGDIGGNRDTMKYLKGLQVEFNKKCFDEDTTPLLAPQNLGPRPLTSDLAQLEELRLYQERGSLEIYERSTWIPGEPWSSYDARRVKDIAKWEYQRWSTIGAINFKNIGMAVNITKTGNKPIKRPARMKKKWQAAPEAEDPQNPRRTRNLNRFDDGYDGGAARP